MGVLSVGGTILFLLGVQTPLQTMTFEENIPLVADMQNYSTIVHSSVDNETDSISQISESEQDFSISQLFQLETTGEEGILV